MIFEKNHIFLIVSIFLLSILSFTILKKRSKHTLRYNLIHSTLLILNLLSLTAYLYTSGKNYNHCPIYLKDEIFIFLSWSITISFLICGRAFYTSAFISVIIPILVTLNILALANNFNLLSESLADSQKKFSLPVEVHITFIFLATGTLTVNFISSLFFIIEDNILKSRSIKMSFLFLQN